MKNNMVNEAAYDARDVLDNREGNFVLKHVITGFGQVALDVLGGPRMEVRGISKRVGDSSDTGKRRLLRVGDDAVDDIFDWSRGLQIATMGSMDPIQVTDIGKLLSAASSYSQTLHYIFFIANSGLFLF